VTPLQGPLLLGANQPPDRFYRGGQQIADFRGVPSSGPRVPEDWVASVTSVFSDPAHGPSRLDDGRLLSSAIQDDPVWWLGAAHVSAFGSDPMLLVKLIDAGERLPVHAHPSREFASRMLGAAHGKAEAWYFLSPGSVYLGLRRPMSRDQFSQIVRRQDTDALLDAMHRLEVIPGDVVFVPAGVLHAIGQGAFLVEVQEPEDLSILAEWEGFDLPASAATTQLGVPLDVLLDAVAIEHWSQEQLEQVVVRSGSRVSGLPPAAEPFFRLEQVDVDGEVRFDPGLAVVVSITGSVTLRGDSCLALRGGELALSPAGANVTSLAGNGRLVVARPPEPR
jgi:mannose-6-phosphate isomerase